MDQSNDSLVLELKATNQDSNRKFSSVRIISDNLVTMRLTVTQHAFEKHLWFPEYYQDASMFYNKQSLS